MVFVVVFHTTGYFPCYKKPFFFSNDVEIEILICGSSLNSDIIYQLNLSLDHSTACVPNTGHAVWAMFSWFHRK